MRAYWCMRKRSLFSIILLLSIIQGIVGPTRADTNSVFTKADASTMPSIATAFSPVTTDLTYDYSLTQTMVGGEPAWFRSCTWGEFPVIVGGAGTGSPPVAFIGGDPKLRQTIRVRYWSDIPVDLYFLTRDQELSWLYHISLWPYQFCAPPFANNWTYGWDNATYASFNASLPAGTCPCSILIFNMKASEAHVRFVVDGLGISDLANKSFPNSNLTYRRTATKDLQSQVSSGLFAAVALVLAIVLVIGTWVRAKAIETRRKKQQTLDGPKK